MGAVVHKDLKNAEDYATLEHIVPKSRGGSNNMENLAAACLQCNYAKGNRLVEDMVNA